MKVYFSAGLNEQDSPNIYEAASGSVNFELSKDSYGLKPRPPFDLEATAPNAADVRGLMQLIKRDNTQTTLVQAGGTVYRWGGSSTFSSMGSCATSSSLRGTTWSLDDYLVITDLQKQTVVSKWDGTTFGTLTTGLGSSLYAKFSIVWNGRVWLFNVRTSTDTPHLMVASAFENPTSYDVTNRAGSATLTAGTEAFYMLTPDLRPINGVGLFFNTLVVSTEGGRLYKVTGDDSRDYALVDFYSGSQAISDEAIANIGNDLIYVRRGGSIDLLSSTDRFGDVSADDVSRWIPDQVRNLTSAIAVYDRQNQKALFFTGSKVLVFFKDIFYGGALLNEKGERAKLSPWSVYTTDDSGNFAASCALYMVRPGTNTFTVMFGDSSGRILNLNGTGAADAGSSNVQVIRKTRFIENTEGVDFMRRVTRGRVRYRRIAEVPFAMEFDWGDEYNTSTVNMTLDGPPADDSGAYFGDTIYFGGDIYFSQGFDFAGKISHQHFSTVGKGPGVTVTCYSETDKQFQIDHIEFL